MEIILPSVYGFCRGVRDAINKAEAAIFRAKAENLPCYIYGDIVHSSNVMESLKAKGIIKIERVEDAVSPGYVVIRAHGITDKDRFSLAEKGLVIVDATCPVVLRSQRLIRSSGKPFLIIGKAGHSEVVALLGSGEATLIESEEDLSQLPKGSYDAVVQTTFSLSSLSGILARSLELGIEVNLLNSVCNASIERRKAFLEIADSVEALAVAGERISKNTTELWECGKKTGKPCFLIPSTDEIPPEIYSFRSLGLTAGASCPDTLFNNIKRRLESNA